MSMLLRHWFARPVLLWLLPALLIPALLALWARWRRRQAMVLLGGGTAFREALTRSRRGPASFLLWWFGLTLLVLGAAGPQWGRDWDETATRGRDLVVVLDLSRSMLAEPKSRLERAKESLLDLCERVRDRGGHRLGLVVFAGHAQLVCPLTHDYDHFRDTVKSFDKDHLDPALAPDENAVSGTRIGEALVLAVEAHAEEARGVQDILLVSDGDDPADDEEWVRGIAAAQKRKIPIHTVGVGDPVVKHPIPSKEGDQFHGDDRVMTRLEEEPLREIAKETKGSYIALHGSEYPLGELYLERIASGGDREHGVDALPVYMQRSEWFLTPAFLLLAATLFVGEGVRLRSGIR